jgi:UDP-N-acetylmuramoyl-L-alanyl-D-glutamate--2,6-diaminopimelate ligase
MTNEITISALIDYLRSIDEVVDYHIKNDRTLNNIVSNSNNCNKEVGFVCYQGTNHNLHQFIDNALELDTPIIIVEEESKNFECNWVRVKDSRKAWAYACSFINGHPSKDLIITGITGTNGKSSTVFILGDLFRLEKIKRLTIGTLGFDLDGEKFESSHTTPDPNILYPLFRKAKERGIKHVFMEVSSHSIAQKKIAPIEFSAYGFTSFSQDHLDFHPTMDDYLNTKLMPVSENLAKNHAFVVNHKIIEKHQDKFSEYFEKVNLISTGSKENDLYFKKPRGSNIVELFSNQNPVGSFDSPFIGDYANENLLISIQIASYLLKKASEKFIGHIASLAQIPGRLELVSLHPAIYVDYAHTPDALENVLKAVSLNHPQGIICVFGCGGDRDKEKRPLMGMAAEAHSQMIILTSDNPRSENPDEIIAEIVSGFTRDNTNSNYIIEPDRKKAISLSLDLAKKENLVSVVAGKGHEDYQIIGDQIIEFDDRKIIKELLEKQ